MKGHRDPQRPGESRSFAGRVLRSLTRGPSTGLSDRPTSSHRLSRFRSVPLLAVGALAWIGVSQWSPGEGDAAGDGAAVVSTAPGAGGAVELPVEVNTRVERWMNRFLTDQRETFETFLSREGRYGPMIREKLRDRGMPEDLLYLAMIESGFSVRARSPVSATGLWQFMGPTARQYGLRMDGWVDERRDPVEATDAALDYLEYLHGRYDSWYLAAAAYNWGPGRVSRVLRSHADGRYGDERIYWEIIDHLPLETRNYVPKLLAATILARNAEEYGFSFTPSEPYAFDRVWVPGSTSLARLGRAMGWDGSLLRDMNPHLVRGSTPPGETYPLRIPEGETQRLVATLGSGAASQGARLAD